MFKNATPSIQKAGLLSGYVNVIAGKQPLCPATTSEKERQNLVGVRERVSMLPMDSPATTSEKNFTASGRESIKGVTIPTTKHTTIMVDVALKCVPNGVKAILAFVKWAYQNGYAEGLQIDRINNDGNYEPSNCRFVSPTANAQNRRVPKNNTSGYSGIEYRPKQHDYRVVISVGGVHQHVGLYASLEEAVAARKEAELKYWGCIKTE